MDAESIRDQLLQGSENALAYHNGATQMDCSVSGESAHISHLHIGVDHRRQGNASAIFRVLTDELRKRGVGELTVNVKLTNFDPEQHNIDDYLLGDDVWQDPTVNFLDEHGFTNFDIHEYGNGEDAVPVVQARRVL